MNYQQKVLESARRLAIRFSQDGKEAHCEPDAAGADALARELALQATLIGDGAPVTVRIGRDFVMLEKRAATAIARALIKGKLRLDELNEAERIARDTAILYRSGAPLGLSNDPAIIDQAKKEAAWDSHLRRCMPGGVKSAEAFGVPAVRRGPPPTTH
jgi:hypothetical protein